MSTLSLSYHSAVLPWSPSAEDERRYRRILTTVLVLALLFGLVMPWLPRPAADVHTEELPQRYAKMLLEARPVPPPPVVKREPVVENKKAETPRNDEPKPKPVKQPVVEARVPVPDKSPGEKLAEARKKASGVGLLAMKDELADLRGAPLAVQLNQNIKQGPGVGAGVGAGVGSGAGLGTPVRSLITSNATRGSGGINTAGYSRDTGGGGLAGRATTMVEGVAGGGGGGGAGSHGTVQRGSSGKAARSVEEIKLVFERNKGAIYAIYNRALREDPSLQGKVVLSLTIAPSGEVLDCKVVSSELKAPELEKKLLGRIKSFDFGAKDVDQLTITWPVDFLPS
jgi:TonB family protein